MVSEQNGVFERKITFSDGCHLLSNGNPWEIFFTFNALSIQEDCSSPKENHRTQKEREHAHTQNHKLAFLENNQQFPEENSPKKSGQPTCVAKTCVFVLKDVVVLSFA